MNRYIRFIVTTHLTPHLDVVMFRVNFLSYFQYAESKKNLSLYTIKQCKITEFILHSLFTYVKFK